MAFKMKGSAFKLGNVATKSALKHTESIERGKSATHEDHHEGRADIKRPPGGDSPVPMKSPLEQGVNTEKMRSQSLASEEGFLKKNLRALLTGELWKSEPKKMKKAGKVASSIGSKLKSKLRKKAADKAGDKTATPVKHKMKVRKGGHGSGGMGFMPGTTAEQVKAHDDKYGEGHSNSHASKKIAAAVGKSVAGAGAKLLEKKRNKKTFESIRPK